MKTGLAIAKVMRRSPNVAVSNDLGSFYEGSFESKMSVNEAKLILNIGPFANQAEITKRHRELIKSNHPDQGGSTFLCMKINEAKSIMSDNEQRI